MMNADIYFSHPCCFCNCDNHIAKDHLCVEIDHDSNYCMICKIKNIMGLPFKMAKSKPYYYIFTKGKMLMDGKKLHSATYIVDGLESYNDFLEKVYEGDDYEMDCSIFTELVSLYFNQWILSNRNRCLIINNPDYSDYFSYYKSENVACIYPLKITYIEVDLLYKINGVHKAQWVVKIGSNKYLGLTNFDGNGPKIFTFEMWVCILVKDLLKFIDSDNNEQDVKLIQSYFENDLLFNWGLFFDKIPDQVYNYKKSIEYQNLSLEDFCDSSQLN